MNRVSSNFYFAPSSIQTNYLSSGELSAFTTTNFSISSDGLTNLVLSLSNIQENFDRYQKIIVDWGQGNETYEVSINPLTTQSISGFIIQNLYTTSSALDPNTFNVSLSLFRLPLDFVYDTINVDLNILQPSFTEEYNIKLLKNYNYYEPDTKINNLVLFIEQQNNNGISVVYNEIPNNLTNFVDTKISAALVNFVGDVSIEGIAEYNLSACDCNALLAINRASDGVGPAMVIVTALTADFLYTSSTNTVYYPVTAFTDSALTETSKVINWGSNETGIKYFSVPIYVPELYVNTPQFFLVTIENLFNTFVDPASTQAFVLLEPYSDCNLDMDPCGYAPIPSPSVTPTLTPTITPTVTPTPGLPPSSTPTITPSETVTPTVTPTVTITPTITVTPAITPSETVTPTVTPTVTITPTITVTPAITPSETVTPTVTPTVTITPTITVTPTVTPTNTVTPTPSPAQNCSEPLTVVRWVIFNPYNDTDPSTLGDAVVNYTLQNNSGSSTFGSSLPGGTNVAPGADGQFPHGTKVTLGTTSDCCTAPYTGILYYTFSWTNSLGVSRTARDYPDNDNEENYCSWAASLPIESGLPTFTLTLS